MYLEERTRNAILYIPEAPGWKPEVFNYALIQPQRKIFLRMKGPQNPNNLLQLQAEKIPYIGLSVMAMSKILRICFSEKHYNKIFLEAFPS